MLLENVWATRLLKINAVSESEVFSDKLEKAVYCLEDRTISECKWSWDVAGKHTGKFKRRNYCVTQVHMFTTWVKLSKGIWQDLNELWVGWEGDTVREETENEKEKLNGHEDAE